MKVVIAIVTYNRPEGLRRLLESLAPEIASKGERDVEIVVVDNDSRESARETVEEFRRAHPVNVEYCIEPRRGIPFGRNTAIRRALEKGCDYIAFLDDDEYVLPNWFHAITDAAVRFGASIVTGPVVAEFASTPSRWVKSGRFHSRLRRSTGARLRTTGSGNALIHRTVFEGVTPWFDETMPFTGGTDTLFFRRAVKSGYEIVWADDAVVVEVVPAWRANVRWLVKRHYRLGNTSITIDNKLEQPNRSLSVRHWISAIAKIGVGAIQVIGWGIISRERLIEGLLRCARGWGMVAGLLGRTYEEYRKGAEEALSGT